MRVVRGRHLSSLPVPVGPVVLLALALALLAMAGCGWSGSGAGAASSSDGRLAAVPKFPRSDAAGPSRVKGNVRSRSYLAFDVHPRDIIDWYQTHLDGWTQVGPVVTPGTETVRATWTRGRDRLEVSAAPAPTTTHVSAGTNVQYNLVLRGS